MALPALVELRLRKPCCRARRIFDGWYWRFIKFSLASSAIEVGEDNGGDGRVNCRCLEIGPVFSFENASQCIIFNTVSTRVKSAGVVIFGFGAADATSCTGCPINSQAAVSSVTSNPPWRTAERARRI